MLIRFKQTVSKIIISSVFCTAGLYALNVPLIKVISINIPKSNYSVVEFPFKIKDLQINSFVASVKKKISVKDQAPIGTKKPVLNFSKSNNAGASSKPVIKKVNYLNMTKGVNVLTFKPNTYGYSQMVVWGYKPYPIILTIHVVKQNKGYQFFKFVPVIQNSNRVQEFESMPHEKIIASIVKYLYARNINPKPPGYYDAVAHQTYTVDIYKHGNVVGHLVSNLRWETIGRNYIGQVWLVNVIPNKNYNKPIYVRLYSKMFAAKGIYAVSINRYTISPGRGTEVMIVRYNDNHVDANQIGN